MSDTKRLGTVAILTGIALALLTPGASAQKAPPAADKAAKTATEVPSPCKGLEEAQCGKKGAACIWRAASKRKDGVEVKAHCRKKPDIAKAQAALAAKKAAAPAAAKPATAAATAAPASAKPAAAKPVETTKAAVKKAVTPAPAAPVKTN